MHSVNGIKIAIAVSGLMHTRSIPKDLRLHLEYDRVFISRRNGSMAYDINENGNVRLNQKKRDHETQGLYLVRQISQASSTTLTRPRQDICAGIASQIGKVDFQPLELRKFLRQHVQHLRAQDLNGYSQAFQSSPLRVL